MSASFVGHPAAVALWYATIGVWAVIEIRQALHRRPDATGEDRGSLVAVRLCMAAGILVAPLAHRVTATAFVPNAMTFALSLCVVWAGIGLRW